MLFPWGVTHEKGLRMLSEKSISCCKWEGTLGHGIRTTRKSHSSSPPSPGLDGLPTRSHSQGGSTAGLAQLVGGGGHVASCVSCLGLPEQQGVPLALSAEEKSALTAQLQPILVPGHCGEAAGTSSPWFTQAAWETHPALPRSPKHSSPYPRKWEQGSGQFT